jgi:hypothetical protein
MYKIFLPYFECVEDGTTQGDFLKEFGNDETQGGICLHLAITWLSLHKKDAASKLPNEIWREMKNPITIKQIANNHRAYKQQSHSIGNNVKFYKNLEAEKFSDFNNVNELKETSVALKNLYVIYFKNAGHALASIIVNDKFYLFDPNIGVMTVNVANKDELLEKIYFFYKDILRGEVYVIQ